MRITQSSTNTSVISTRGTLNIFPDFHIFSCKSNIQNHLKVVVKLRKSNADEESEAIKFDMLKAKFFGREITQPGTSDFKRQLRQGHL
jgi:hypothetical protein